MTKYLISGYIGFDNFGDEAIVSVLTNQLKISDAEKITVLSSNPEKTAKVYDVFSKHYMKFFKPILETDVLISGGGSLLQDVTSLKSLIYYLTIITTALIFKKKVIIYAQGFTPFRTKIGKFLTKFILKHCNKITVRDKKSQELLEELNLDSKLVADPVFGIKIPENITHQGLGIQLRSFKTLDDYFLNKLADTITLKFPNETIKLFSLQDSLDLAIIEKFALMLESRNLKTKIYKNLSVNDAILEISTLEYLIGMRFHSALVGAKAGVKTLGINYDIKVLNLAHNIGFPIIGLKQDNIENEFNELINLDTSKYNIPKYIHPKI